MAALQAKSARDMLVTRGGAQGSFAKFTELQMKDRDDLHAMFYPLNPHSFFYVLDPTQNTFERDLKVFMHTATGALRARRNEGPFRLRSLAIFLNNKTDKWSRVNSVEVRMRGNMRR